MQRIIYQIGQYTVRPSDRPRAKYYEICRDDGICATVVATVGYSIGKERAIFEADRRHAKDQEILQCS